MSVKQRTAPRADAEVARVCRAIADPTPPKELIYVTLMNAINVGMFMSLILGADSISGERERQNEDEPASHASPS